MFKWANSVNNFASVPLRSTVTCSLIIKSNFFLNSSNFEVTNHYNVLVVTLRKDKINIFFRSQFLFAMIMWFLPWSCDFCHDHVTKATLLFITISANFWNFFLSRKVLVFSTWNVISDFRILFRPMWDMQVWLESKRIVSQRLLNQWLIKKQPIVELSLGRWVWMRHKALCVQNKNKNNWASRTTLWSRFKQKYWRIRRWQYGTTKQRMSILRLCMHCNIYLI